MWLAAAAEVPSSDNTQIVLGIFTLLGVAATGVTGIVIALINARNKPSPPPAESDGSSLPERVAVLEFRAEDSDDRDAVQDRRHDVAEQTGEAVTRFLDRRFPEWRT